MDEIKLFINQVCRPNLAYLEKLQVGFRDVGNIFGIYEYMIRTHSLLPAREARSF